MSINSPEEIGIELEKLSIVAAILHNTKLEELSEMLDLIESPQALIKANMSPALADQYLSWRPIIDAAKVIVQVTPFDNEQRTWGRGLIAGILERIHGGKHGP